MLKIVRLDDRLVHGQLINNWCTYEDVTEIIVVNKEVAENDIRKTFIELSVPEDIKIIFCDTLKALELYEEECEYEDVIMIFGNPFEVLKFIEGGGKIKSLNLGGMSFKKDKEKINTNLYLDDKEIEALKKISDSGVEIEIRILPTDKKTDFLNTLKARRR
ncbi:hypothetical protein CBE01nite_32290 [Clostridium beijerinckii]|uniref:PTS sugar transporter subunit IIB n=1 Tax=Clostridium beijerinckii TaxID=1520 RepID=A0AB74VA00_CLOBE|nr:PTS sugar transporter subunit IIB [Clostridium beijerinckii]NOW90975.1 PTS system mannose-specific IIB component [Clostridium beijerinckii]NRZ27417.1 PTS system mannose-specific IIB component [Clostridium beijerinckii]NYB96792.1 PTS system mannose-specific IIB component [Clostridium beijerinckii]OOM22639.1 PTS system mannose-specific EIIAB component [Clostridium beijerinckii]QUN33253.1 PTS sugar transporter subunit IIB [Clostridium beijerinckii]